MIPAAAFSQTDVAKNEKSPGKDFVEKFKKAGSWATDGFYNRLREAKIEGCVLSYEVLTRRPLDARIAPGDRAASFSERTDVDAIADLSKNWLTTRFVTFDLAAVDIDALQVEKGYVENTSFIRVPLIGARAQISAKNGHGTEVRANGDTGRPTLVVKAGEAAELARVFTETVRACRN